MIFALSPHRPLPNDPQPLPKVCPYTNSMLNWTERIIRMRKEVPEVGWGDFKVIAPRSRRARHGLRLAQQLGSVRAQLA
jgi:hypothetical protein